MLILAKAAMAIMLGFVISMVFGFFFVRFAKGKKIGQSVSTTLGERHIKKNGIPTMGGFIFIVPVLVSIFLLYIRGSIIMNHNLFILLFVFVAYAFLGFIDDYLKIHYKNNKGISITTKFLLQMAIALVFFYVFMKNGGEPVLWITSIGVNIHMGWLFGIFILFVLVGTSNAVNITDGLDGLAGSYLL